MSTHQYDLDTKEHKPHLLLSSLTEQQTQSSKVTENNNENLINYSNNVLP